MKFYVRSSFVDPARGNRQVLPSGLEWGLPGASSVLYVPAPPAADGGGGGGARLAPTARLAPISVATSTTDEEEKKQQESEEYRRQHLVDEEEKIKFGIVRAHNRWCYAKDLPFRTVSEIRDVEPVLLSRRHSNGANSSASDSDTGRRNDDDDGGVVVEAFRVTWCDDDPQVPRKVCPLRSESDLTDLLRQDVLDDDEAASNDSSSSNNNTYKNNNNIRRSTTEVWVNGEYVDVLTSESLNRILERVANGRSVKVKYHKSSSRTTTIIRVERYFRGLVSGYELFDHVLDNMIALEDVEDHGRYLIGTATLPDWIMGGMLTSRFYVEQRGGLDGVGDIIFARPLYNDDLNTSDRSYKLLRTNGADVTEKIRIAEGEIRRLRYLARLSDRGGAVVIGDEEKFSEEESQVAKQHRRNRRKKFAL